MMQSRVVGGSTVDDAGLDIVRPRGWCECATRGVHLPTEYA